MSEQGDVVATLEGLGVLGGVRWAYRSAAERTLETYSEDDDHDATWFGTTRHTLFKGRLHRVFGTERYQPSPDTTPEAHRDLLTAQLSDRDIQTLPTLDAGVVRYSPLNGSPGWAMRDYRLLLASGLPGKLLNLLWSDKSDTKQRVAAQPSPDPDQPSLFTSTEDDELLALEAVLAPAADLDMPTFVVAHSLDSLAGLPELLLGRPRLNVGGGPAWHWYEDLLKTPPPGGGRLPDTAPMPSDPDAEDDAPVRLRQPGDQRPGQQHGGAA